MEFLGRTDHQVKIRGFRIELGEIESALEQHPAVRQAVAVARENGAGDKYIVAYIASTTNRSAPIAELRRHLKDRVPEYMLPSALVEVAEFPLTANGKVDRKALPAPRSSDITAGQEFVAPRNETERKLVSLWEEILQVRPIGVTTSFFELGGRSLDGARLFMRIGQVFGKDLPVSKLIFADTVEALAKELQSGSDSESYRTLIPYRTQGSRPPFFCVHNGLGSTFFLRHLAAELHPEQPFYGIESEGRDGRRIEQTTLQLMAAQYVSEIRKIQPRGPYFLGGYCFGGIVAVEMAQQLRCAGEEPALVALFSAPLRFNRRTNNVTVVPPSSRKDLRALIRSLRAVLIEQLKKIKWGTLAGVQMGTCELFLHFGKPVPQFLRNTYVGRMLYRAEMAYIPEPYPGTLDLFYQLGLWDDDPGLGWNGLADRLEHHIISDTQAESRRDIFNPPVVQLLAREFTSTIEKRSNGNGAPDEQGSSLQPFLVA